MREIKTSPVNPTIAAATNSSDTDLFLLFNFLVELFPYVVVYSEALYFHLKLNGFLEAVRVFSEFFIVFMEVICLNIFGKLRAIQYKLQSEK